MTTPWRLIRHKRDDRLASVEAGQRRIDNRVLWYRIVGTDRLFRDEGDAYREVVRDLEDAIRREPGINHLGGIVMPWWVWDGKDPLNPDFGNRNRADASFNVREEV